MVRRLVEQQDIRISEERLREQHLDLERSLQRPELAVVQLRIDAKSREQRLRVGFRLPAVHLRELALELGSPYAVLVGKVFFGVNGVLLFHHLIEPGVPEDDRVEDLVVVVFEVILLKERDAVAGRHGDRSVRRLQLSRQNLQEGGLAGAICADEAVAVSFREFDIDIFKQCFLADPVGHADGFNHLSYTSSLLYVFSFHF